MEKFRELYIKVDEEHTGDFVAAVEAALTDGWSRASEAEDNARQHGVDDRDFCYFLCDDRKGRQPAMVSIYRRDAETLYVSNVVPLAGFQLSHQQYNTVLQDFHDCILTKLHAKFPITFMLGSDQLRIERMMSPEAFKRLTQFSGSANKSTGSSHPKDCERWYAFLVTLNQTRHNLDAGSLLRWLIEVEQWPENVAQDLVSQFEFAMGLLKYKI
ncbi:MAG TPA: hypothetical protein VH597_15100 [Verrucomicrobiae bacterium]|jgi:hypothetical protein|nr:hypothetical protein [Verrucomicrobiae bacterium]